MKTYPHARPHSWGFPGILLISGVCLCACAQQRTAPGPRAGSGARATPADHPRAVVLTSPGNSQLVIAEPSVADEPTASPAPIASTAVSPRRISRAPQSAQPARAARADQPPVLAEPALDEVIGLYRRLHAELDAEGRSVLITELLSDPRKRILDLGFELAHRNLSARTALSTAVGDAASVLLSGPDPSIRGQAAGLITRLVTPDAMVQLTEALNTETSSVAVEPMLLGVARWPNADATEAVVRWFADDNAPFDAAATTAWAFEQNGMLTLDEQRGRLLSALRTKPIETLSLPGMKLLATLGGASDLDALAGLLATDDAAMRSRAATALVETPRATQLLVRAARSDAQLYGPASESLIAHHATPEGIKQLAALEAPSEAERGAMLDRMAQRIDIDDLTAGVVQAGLDDETVARLLSRLLGSDIERSGPVIEGLGTLARIELGLGHPEQALDILDSLSPTSIEALDELGMIRMRAAIGSGALDHESLEASKPGLWFEMLEGATDPAKKQSLIAQIHQRFGAELTEQQHELLDSAGKQGLTENPEIEPEDG